MATAVFTTVEARVDQALTNAIWADEIKDNINQLAGAHSQLLTDGGFEVWQRGSTFTAAGVFTADGWTVNNADGTHTTTRETAVVDKSQVSLKCVFTRGSADGSIFQKVEDYFQVRGKTVSFSIRVYQNTANAVKAYISDGTPTYSATSATTGSFVTLTVTAALSGAATLVTCGVVMTASVAVYLDNAMLVIGPAPAPYQPLHPADELARCQRYYEVHGGATGPPTIAAYGAAGQTGGLSIGFAVVKGGIPTMTKNGTWAVVNCGQPVTSSPTAAAYNLSATVTALGTFSFNPNSSDDTIVAEFNP